MHVKDIHISVQFFIHSTKQRTYAVGNTKYFVVTVRIGVALE